MKFARAGFLFGGLFGFGAAHLRAGKDSLESNQDRAYRMHRNFNQNRIDYLFAGGMIIALLVNPYVKFSFLNQIVGGAAMFGG